MNSAILFLFVGADPAPDPTSVNDLVALLVSHKWVAASAVAIGLVVRLLKSDTKIPINIPAAYRTWIALGLGIVSGVLDKIANGTPWKDAIVGGLGAAFTAIVGHEMLIESMRGGREIPVPGLMKPPSGSDGGPYRTPAPKDPPPPSKPVVPPQSAAMMLLVVALGALLPTTQTGCGASFQTVAGYVELGVSDAESLLGFAKSMVDGYFAAHPDPASQAKADQGIAAAQLALDSGLRALEGVQDVSQSQAQAAFAQFAAAWNDLATMLAQLGVLQNIAAPHKNAVNAPALPTPMLVVAAKTGRFARWIR